MSLYKDASLVMIPSAYKDGKLYSIRPTDGSGDFTFSRGSNLAATRVDVNGLIEKGRENLLLQSNQFDTTWFNSNSTETSGQSGYDGSNNAWLLTKSAAGGRINQSVSLSGVQTLSIYAKAGTLDWLRFITIGGTTSSTYFDLANGSVGSVLSSIDTSITSIGNGWYRCSVTTNQPLTEVRIYPADADNDTSGTSGNIYIQDSQLEAGLVATDYIETGASTAQAGILEDMPRLDYSGGASCPALLLEPQRSNLVDDYSGYTWDSFNGAAISFSGTQQSPEGLNNAVTWTFGGTSGEVVQRSSISISNTTAYTISGYFKLTSGTLTSGSNQLKGLDGLSGGSVSLNTLTSEWQRLSFSVTSSSTLGRVQLRCDNSATIQVYGLQLEAGSYETSIIPTYGASVTRSLDTFEVTGINDLIDSQGGVMLLETQALDTNQGYSGISLSDDTFTNNAQIRYGSATNQIQVQYRVGSSNECLASNSENDITNNLKIAFKYEADSFKMFVNGVLEATDTSGSVNAANTFDTIKSDRGDGGDKYLGKIKQLVVFPTALTDSECIALTTL